MMLYRHNVSMAYCVVGCGLPFLNRQRELTRLRRAVARPGESLIVVSGRRRCGKSRLLQEALRGHRHVYYVADLSAAGIQRQALAAEMERVVPGFAARILS